MSHIELELCNVDDIQVLGLEGPLKAAATTGTAYQLQGWETREVLFGLLVRLATGALKANSVGIARADRSLELPNELPELRKTRSARDLFRRLFIRSEKLAYYTTAAQAAELLEKGWNAHLAIFELFPASLTAEHRNTWPKYSRGDVLRLLALSPFMIECGHDGESAQIVPLAAEPAAVKHLIERAARSASVSIDQV